MSATSGGWRPLLVGEEAERALAVVHEIAAATAGGLFPPQGLNAPEAAPVRNHVLRSGLSGQCLLHAYLALGGAGDRAGDEALEMLDRATEAAATAAMSASLFVGFPGIAWAAAHLEHRLYTEEGDGNEEVDELLLAALARSTWASGFNLYDGLAGVGVYALERLPRPGAVRLLDAVIANLAGRAERTADGATFYTPCELLPKRYQQDFPEGAYVLGMGQGVAGPIAFLGAALQSGYAPSNVRALLGELVSWLLARRLPPGEIYRFSHFYLPDLAPYPCRVGWTTGDLGIAASLLLAARAAGEPAWEEEARALARLAAARTIENSRVPDAGLSAGAAGAGHVFNRLFQATGEPELARAARTWMGHALALREPGLGVAGFRAFADPRPWDDPGFLSGATGIGLALLAACTSQPPSWDRLLLLSTRVSEVSVAGVES